MRPNIGNITLLVVIDINTLSGVSDENELGMYCHNPRKIIKIPATINKFDNVLVLLKYN
jgi:hypothetical protein